MSYLVSQLWLCLLLALFLGGLIGWLLRGGCKTKLATMRDDWEQRYTLLEDEKNSFALKVQDGKRLNSERKNLLSRLTAMENGANVASSVLKENKNKLDETESSLATIKLELQQRDIEISELKKNKNNNEEESVVIQGLLDTQISESNTLKSQLEQDLSTKDEAIEALMGELVTAQGESKSNYDQLETLQALLDAHEEGSSVLSDEAKKLTETLSATEELHLEQKKKSIELSSQFDLKEKQMQASNLALKAEVEELKNTVNSSQEKASLLLKQSSSHEEKTQQTQGLLDKQAKDLESYKLEAERNESKLLEELKQKKSELEELTSTLTTVKKEIESKRSDTDSLQLLFDEQKASNQAQSEKETELKKALSLSDKLNIDYEEKTADFVSQLALKDEKIKEVELVLSDTKQQLEMVEPQVNQIKSLMHEYEKSSKDMLGKLSLLESQSDTYQAELLDVESKLKATQERLEYKEKESNDELSRLKLKLQASDDEVQLMKGKLSNSESKIAEHSKEKVEFDKEIAQLNNRLDSKETNGVVTSHLDDSEKNKKKEVAKSVSEKHENVTVAKESSKSSLKPQGLISSTATENTKISRSSNEYEIETIEGIGKAYGEKLRKLDISTTKDLLNRATSSADVHDIANKLKQQSWVIRSWVSMSDLLRVDGVDGQYAELLEFSGIHSVQSLAKQTANPLSKKMFSLNEKEHRVKVAPESATVAEWIIYATTLSPRLTDNLESIQKEDEPKVSPKKPESLKIETKNESNNTQKNSYDIEEIDGIGKGYGRRLRAMGIHTTTKLLNKCTNTDYEKNIAQAMTLNEKVVKSWCQMADLIRVEGVDGQLADLLFFSGITSAKELSIKSASKLTNKIESVNKSQQRMKETPTQEMVAMWIASAKSLCK